MSSPEVPDPDEEVVPGGNHTGALPFVDIQSKIRAVVKTRDGSSGFTYSPKSDLVFDVRRRHECLALFRELVRGNRRFRTDRPVYLIAVTCRKNIEVDDTLRHGYEMISESSNQPLIGYWRSPTGDPYLDAVAAMQFISREDATRAGKRHGQKFILAITSNGRHEYIETHKEHVRP